MGWFGGVHVEVNFAVALLAEQCGDEAQQRGFVVEEGGDTRAAFEFLVYALDGIAGAHPCADVRSGEVKMERMLSAASVRIS